MSLPITIEQKKLHSRVQNQEQLSSYHYQSQVALKSITDIPKLTPIMEHPIAHYFVVQPMPLNPNR